MGNQTRRIQPLRSYRLAETLVCYTSFCIHDTVCSHLQSGRIGVVLSRILESSECGVPRRPGFHANSVENMVSLCDTGS